MIRLVSDYVALRRCRLVVTLSLIGVYTALMLIASACPQEPTRGDIASHHHGTAHHKSLHSVLCAWACQTSFSLLAFDHQTVSPFLLLISLVTGWFHRHVQSLHGPIQSRAPPVALRSR